MSKSQTSSTLELEDIQGILLSGYPNLPAARYLMLRFEDSRLAREWLGQLSHSVATAKTKPIAALPSVQICFTYPGLEVLGLSWQALKGFSSEFKEGMHGGTWRSRVLGDVGESAPSEWQWGGPGNEPVHAALLLYAPDDAALDLLTEQHRANFARARVAEVQTLDTRTLPDQKEHFGFRDGISQPKLAGLTTSTDEAHVCAPGEFVLGYPNELGQYTTRPRVDPIQDTHQFLPADRTDPDQRDFGRNGSYLVLRQLAQDVHGFWNFVHSRSLGTNDSAPDLGRERLAAKMMGRWRSGASLVVAPDNDAPEHAQQNDFRYRRADRDGLRCPLGAHVRRTNPRDSLPPRPGSSASLKINRRHRLLRRGRTYGPPLVGSMDPSDVLATPPDQVDRGLHFLCFNASINRQFEFVQQSWANNPNFNELTAETDPVIGDRRRGAATFTVPAEPVRTRVHGLPQFVHTRGGAYFFLPGLRALRYLAAEPRPLADAYSAPAPDASDQPVSLGLHAARFTSRVIEHAVLLTRRFTRLRAVFDGLFLKPVVALVQYLIQARRRNEGLALAEERLIPGEVEVAQQITETMTRFLFRHYRQKTAERAGNTKTHGLLRATFEVNSDLPEHFQAGVFQNAARYDAYVRFGGPGPAVTPDIMDNGVLSIGIKLMGVGGPKLLDEEQQTQDFTGISAPTFTTPNVVENLKLQQHIRRRTPVFYFLNPFDSHYLDAVMQGIYAKAHGSPLEADYFSCVPYLFGEGRAIKYSLAPQLGTKSRVPWRPSPNYLREAMVRALGEREVCFDFFIQEQTDPHRMPIEDASVIWPAKLSPPVKVAVLRIHQQIFDTPQRAALARSLSFNPWHSLAEHRPLGNQNRARRLIYLHTSQVRQAINADHRVEPTGDEEALSAPRSSHAAQ